MFLKVVLRLVVYNWALFFLRFFSVQNPVLISVFEISCPLSLFVTFKILLEGSTQISDLG